MRTTQALSQTWTLMPVTRTALWARGASQAIVASLLTDLVGDL